MKKVMRDLIEIHTAIKSLPLEQQASCEECVARIKAMRDDYGPQILFLAVILLAASFANFGPAWLEEGQKR